MAYDIEKDWATKAGLRAVVIVCKSGKRKTHRCGYVAVPVGHPLHGVGYSDQADCLTQDMAQNAAVGNKSPILALTAGVGADSEGLVRRSPDTVFECHGGITYAGGNNYPAKDDGWWFGFDCNHYMDADIEPDPQYSSFRDGEVRELDYVERECESLAQQIAAITQANA